MAAAIVDLELVEGIPDVADLEPYTRAFVILRYQGVPFGHAWLPVSGGRVSRDAIVARILGPLLPDSRRWAECQLGHARSPSPLPRATIAICTRDRPADLARALNALVPAAGDRYPIVVVDNCPSSGASRDVVSAWPGVTYLREDQPGLNRARNRALREAQTDVVAFTDDDAVPERGWIEALLRNFDHRLILGVR